MNQMCQHLSGTGHLINLSEPVTGQVSCPNQENDSSKNSPGLHVHNAPIMNSYRVSWDQFAALGIQPSSLN
jgi:hypothetical protein